VWFKGEIIPGDQPTPAAPEVVSCADPRAEVVEALRWARELIATGRASPGDIAIASASTRSWDEHVLALAAHAELPLHSSHGVPAIACFEGQACGALADILLNGLSQDRVRRLLRHRACLGGALGDLPAAWGQGIPRDAALLTVGHWRRVLEISGRDHADRAAAHAALMPVLEFLARGTSGAKEIGETVLRGNARLLWTEALERAPASALEYALQEVRLPDGKDPGASVVWCPAGHLAAAPRHFVWLLGMNARSLAAARAGGSARPQPRCATRGDRSRPRRRAGPARISARYQSRGRRLRTLKQSPERRRHLAGREPPGYRSIATPLAQAGRIPAHAVCEADRLLARPREAAVDPAVVHAMSCWQDWQRSNVTAHDGRVRIDHPVILRAIEDVQSPTSLRLMLRDPLAFVWRYALGWQPRPEELQPLTLDARAYGELVHDLLKRAVDSLEPRPGYTRAARHEIEDALSAAKAVIAEHWPLERAVPPPLLWHHFLETAERLALGALTHDKTFQAGTRSWTEVTFGLPAEHMPATASADVPWQPTSTVSIPGIPVSVRGSIDRLDLTSTGNAVRVSDYKTGAMPRNADRIVIGGGSELQRVIYALASRQLLPDVQRIVARLIYLDGDTPAVHQLPDVDLAIESLTTHVTTAIETLRRGISLSGPDAGAEWNDFRLCCRPQRRTICF